jgi:hypothetical protein
MTLIGCGVGYLVAGGCAARELEQPLETHPIEKGQETVETARTELQGRWSLVSLVVQTEDGQRADVDASGTLSTDDFGNMQIEYRLTTAGQKAIEAMGVRSPNPVISTTGRVVIDTQQRRITFVPPDAATRVFDPALAALRANPFALERTRYYALGDAGVLTLTTRHDNGQDAAVSRWTRP